MCVGSVGKEARVKRLRAVCVLKQSVGILCTAKRSWMVSGSSSLVRLSDVKGRTSSKNARHKTRQNIIASVDTCAVVHLGDVTPHETENAPAFLVFDRKYIHRVIDELHKGGNSTYVDRYDSTSVVSQNYPVRANGAKGLEVLNLLCFTGGCLV